MNFPYTKNTLCDLSGVVLSSCPYVLMLELLWGGLRHCGLSTVKGGLVAYNARVNASKMSFYSETNTVDISRMSFQEKPTGGILKQTDMNINPF